MKTFKKLILMSILTVINIIMMYFIHISLLWTILVLLEHFIILLVILYHDVNIFTKNRITPKKTSDGSVGFQR